MSSRRVIIALKGLGALANHGVYDFERTQRQRFCADVVMWVETAGANDDIAATVSYADIADETMAVLTGSPVDLIETLAEDIASRVMSHDGVVGTEVTVHKPDAPIDQPFADVSVTVRAGATDALPLSLTLKGIYEAEDGSVLTGEIEAYGRAQAPSPAEQGQGEPSPSRRSGATAPGAREASMPEHLRSRKVVLAIGGNLGDVPVTLMHTVEALSYMEGFQIDDVSPIMRTKPVLAPGQAPQPDYWNAVVIGSAIATPDELFAQTSRIERELGRERHERWGARTVDIDIIQVEGLASSDPVLSLPHPRAKERAFVLAPWLLCDPDAVLEGFGRVADLLALTPDREGIIDAVDDWLEDPAAVMADSDQLLAERAEQASADMRELIETLTGEISQVDPRLAAPAPHSPASRTPATPTTPDEETAPEPDEPEERAGASGGAEAAPADARGFDAGGESERERRGDPRSVDPATWNNLWSRWAATEVGEEIANAMGIERPPAPEAVPGADEPEELLEEDIPPVAQPETPAQLAARAARQARPVAPPSPRADAPQGEGQRPGGVQAQDERGVAEQSPDDPSSASPAQAASGQEASPRRAPRTSARPSWHPISSVPADSPAGRMTRKIGTGTYKPRNEDRPHWVPVFDAKRDDPHSDIALPDWNFPVGSAHDVRVVDDRSGLAREEEPPKPTVHADGRSTILAPGLPDNTPVGPIPEDEATQTGILRRVVVRPTMTGAIPVVKRR